MNSKKFFIYISLLCTTLPAWGYESGYDQLPYGQYEEDEYDYDRPRYNRRERSQKDYDNRRFSKEKTLEDRLIAINKECECWRKNRDLEDERRRRSRDLEDERRRLSRDQDEKKRLEYIQNELDLINRNKEPRPQVQDLQKQVAIEAAPLIINTPIQPNIEPSTNTTNSLKEHVENLDYQPSQAQIESSSDYAFIEPVYLPVYLSDPRPRKNFLAKWNYPTSLYIEQTFGRWIGDQGSYTSVGVFSLLPRLRTTGIIPFIDIRGHYFSHGSKAGNFGGGFRYKVPNRQMVVGINAFYDYRNTSFHRYQQLGLGLEALGYCWDFSINGYIPVGKKVGHSRLHVFDDYTCDDFATQYFATCRDRQSSLCGVNFQLGRWFIRKFACRCYDLYGAITPYYYNSRKHTMAGADISLTTNIGRYFYAQVRGGYDSTSKGIFQGRIGVEIPLFTPSDCCSPCYCDDLMSRRIQREEIIILDKKDCCWTWNWDSCDCSCCR